MKKIASLVVAALITCSLGACGNRNTAYDNLNNNPTPINTSQDNFNKANAPNIGTTTVYKDGIYLGNGNNRGATGNESAIVTIKGGRITDVVLKSIDAQGKDITYYSTTGGTTRATTPGVNNRTLKNGTTGTSSGNNFNVSPYGNYNNAVGNVSPYGNYNNTIGTRNYSANYDGTGKIGKTTDTNRTTGTTGASALEISRKNLSNAIIKNQTPNVTISTNEKTAIDNWKLAVTRALESARR